MRNAAVGSFTGLLLLFLLNACSSTTTIHRTYNYANFSCPSNATVQPKDDFATLSLDSGYQLSVKWQPFPDQLSTEATPSPVSLSAELLGPFSSLSTARQVNYSDAFGVSGPVVVSISPIHTDDWTNKTYISTMRLPPQLITGYYVEIEEAESTNNNGTFGGTGMCVLKIIP